MFENKEIVRNLVKPFLKEMGFDPMGQNPLPDIVVFHKAKEEPLLVHKEKPYTLGQLAEAWRKEIFSIITKQGYGGGSWFYKGAKICLFWPLWAEAFPEAQWIIVRRHPEDIVRSCFKTAFMRGYRSRSGWLRWVAEHEKRFEEMADAKLKIYEVWPQRAINGDLIELQMVVNDLGLEWKADEVAKFYIWAKESNLL